MGQTNSVVRAVGGDFEAFRELVTGHRAFVFAICVSTLHEAAEAEDLVQEVFLRVYRDLPGLRDPEKFRPWLRQLTKNVCRRTLQARRVASGPLEDASDVVDETAGEAVRRAELRGLVGETLARVTPRSREVLALHYLAGCTEAEIAKTLGVSAATVKSRLYEGRGQARRALQPLVKELLTLENRSEEAVSQILNRCGSPSCVCPETLTEGR